MRRARSKAASAARSWPSIDRQTASRTVVIRFPGSRARTRSKTCAAAAQRSSAKASEDGVEIGEEPRHVRGARRAGGHRLGRLPPRRGSPGSPGAAAPPRRRGVVVVAAPPCPGSGYPATARTSARGGGHAPRQVALLPRIVDDVVELEAARADQLVAAGDRHHLRLPAVVEERLHRLAEHRFVGGGEEPSLGLLAGPAEERRVDLAQAHRIGARPRPDAVAGDDERDPHDALVEQVAVQHLAVIAAPLAVVGGHDDPDLAPAPARSRTRRAAAPARGPWPRSRPGRGPTGTGCGTAPAARTARAGRSSGPRGSAAAHRRPPARRARGRSSRASSARPCRVRTRRRSARTRGRARTAARAGTPRRRRPCRSRAARRRSATTGMRSESRRPFSWTPCSAG